MSNKSTCSARTSSDVENYCDIMQQIITTFPHLTLLYTFCLAPCIPSCKYRRSNFSSHTISPSVGAPLLYGHSVGANRGVYTTFNGVFFPSFPSFFVARIAFSCVVWYRNSDGGSPLEMHGRKFPNRIAWCKTISSAHCTFVHAANAWTHRGRAPFSNKRDGHIQRIVEIKMAKRQTVIAWSSPACHHIPKEHNLYGYSSRTFAYEVCADYCLWIAWIFSEPERQKHIFTRSIYIHILIFYGICAVNMP